MATPEEQAGWEEIYGPDYPFTAGDVPVLTNSLARLRYDTTNTPGFLYEAWNGAGWTVLGKIVLQRADAGGAGTNPLDTLRSAALVEYTPERAVIAAVMSASADGYSRESVYLTLQRGWTGPRIEIYASAGPDGTVNDVGAEVMFTAADLAPNDSIAAIDASESAIMTSTAGSGTDLLSTTPASLGASGFPGENWIHLLREGEAFAVTLAVVQAATNKAVLANSLAFGSERNAMSVETTAGGYVSAHLGCYKAAASQVIEAEAIITGSSTASIVTDAGASGGHAVKDTQTANSNDTLFAGASSLKQARYRAFARVHVDSGVSATLLAALQHSGSGSDFSITPSITLADIGWAWVDLGEAQAPSDTPDVIVTGWVTSGSGGVYIDRIELVKVEDRLRSGSRLNGARDLGASALADVRQRLRLIARG